MLFRSYDTCVRSARVVSRRTDENVVPHDRHRRAELVAGTQRRVGRVGRVGEYHLLFPRLRRVVEPVHVGPARVGIGSVVAKRGADHDLVAQRRALTLAPLAPLRGEGQ